MISIRSCDSLNKISYGVMPDSRFGTFARSISMPLPARLAVSHVEQVSPAAPMSWMPATASWLKQLKARFEQKFLLKRIADLHCRTIFARLLGQFTRSKRRPGQAIAPRLRADIKNWITNAACGAARQLFMTQHAKTKNIYERIALETLIEIDFTANRRDPDAISVMRDPGDDAGEQPPIGGQFRISP